MFLTSVVIVCVLFALLFFAFAMHRWRRRRVLAGTGHLLASILLGFAAVCVALFGATLLSYERLTHEQPAVEVSLKRSGERHYQAHLTYPSTLTQDFELLGDEWQVDARLLKWKGLGHWLGFDTVYRLERIGGRYTDLAMEKTGPRTVHSLASPDTIDLWALARENRDRLPWIDALYGSATYVPMADGAVYQVTVSPSGLVARPLNQAARDAVGGWK